MNEEFKRKAKLDFDVIEKEIKKGMAVEDLLSKIGAMDNSVVFLWVGIVLERNKEIAEFKQANDLFNKIIKMNKVEQLFILNKEMKKLEELIKSIPINSATRYAIHLLFLIFEGLNKRNEYLDQTKPFSLPLIGKISRTAKTRSVVDAVRQLELRAKVAEFVPATAMDEVKEGARVSGSTKAILSRYLREQGVVVGTLEERRLLIEGEQLLGTGFSSGRVGYCLNLRLQGMRGREEKGLDKALNGNLLDDELGADLSSYQGVLLGLRG